MRMENLCIRCKKREIFVKKRGLCRKCSAIFYKNLRGYQTKDKSNTYQQRNIRHRREVEFIKNFFVHKNWIYHPAIFRMDEENYEPDFYDGKRNVFIEVSGTKQAFSKNKEKYQRFIAIYPAIEFELRYHTGELIPFNELKFRIPEKRNFGAKNGD